MLGTVLVGLLATLGVAAFGLISWWWVALPATLLVAWLVACRLMVRHERNARFDSSIGTPDEPPVEERAPAPVSDDPVFDALDDTSQTPAITDPSLWDPMPVTLPTYVTAPRRRPPYGPDHRPRLHRRVDLRPLRGRHRAGPRGRGGRADGARPRRAAAARHRLLSRSRVGLSFRRARLRVTVHAWPSR